MDILTLLEDGADDINSVVTNPLAMVGNPESPFLGLTLMPERLVDQNQFEETRISYKTFIANNGTKYSPVQLKGGIYTGSFDVKTNSSDIGAQLTAQDYEAILKIVSRYSGKKIPMTALMLLLKWVNKSGIQPLVVKNERMIWECIVDAEIQIEGDDGYITTVKISKPDGHRVAAGDWNDPDYNPMDDIYVRADHLKSKDFSVARMIAPNEKIQQLCRHPKVVQMARGFITVGQNGSLVGSENRLTINGLNAFFSENELPPVERYDKTYNVQGGAPRRFLKNNAWVFVGRTDQSEEIEIQDGDNLVIDNTLGYTAVGTNAGYTNPGRMSLLEAKGGKAPHVDGQFWQESIPVNQNPEAVDVLTDIPVAA